MNITSVSPGMGMPAGDLSVRMPGDQPAPAQPAQAEHPEIIAATQTTEAASAAGQSASGQAVDEDSAQQQLPGRQPSNEEVQNAIDEVRRAIEPVARNLLFSVDDDTGKTLIKIVDSATDEVIRQIPSEEMVAISKAIDRLQGLLFQEKA